jgi:signal transduction histidine kinase
MGELTASLSHELNQPLTAIRNSAQAGLRFMRSGKSDPEMMDEILNNIVEDDKRASDVLSSIRQLMRFEKREKQKINLSLKIRQIIDIFKGESKKQNIFLNVNLPDHPVYVLGDRTQIQQVLLNLISNAANAMEGTNNKEKTIDIIEKIDNESVTVSVRDYGAGIDESIKSKLFKPFITTKENGTGIGLAISKTIIDEHGGKIWAENNPDGGASFSFQLNLYKND